MDLRDKGPPLSSQAARPRRARRASPRIVVRAAAWAFLGFLASCGENRPPPPAAPDVAPARDVVVRTGRFALHANAYVDYYAGVRAAALSLPDADQEPFRAVDEALVASLGRCSDDRCARAAFAPLGDLVNGLDRFLKDTWPDHAFEARRTLGLNGAPLLDLEDALASALATQIGRLWPDEPTVLYLVRVDQGSSLFPRDLEGPLMDIRGGCFGGHALLECIFVRALEVSLAESDLGRAVTRTREPMDEARKNATRSVLPCIAALAAAAAVAAADRMYQPTKRYIEACPSGTRKGFEDALRRRMKGEIDAAVLGKELVEKALSVRATE
jgi:hypothetical protein